MAAANKRLSRAISRPAGGPQSAPIHMAIVMRKVLMHTSDTTSWKKSAINASCSVSVHTLFSFCFKVNAPAARS